MFKVYNEIGKYIPIIRRNRYRVTKLLSNLNKYSIPTVKRKNPDKSLSMSRFAGLNVCIIYIINKELFKKRKSPRAVREAEALSK